MTVGYIYTCPVTQGLKRGETIVYIVFEKRLYQNMGPEP